MVNLLSNLDMWIFRLKTRKDFTGSSPVLTTKGIGATTSFFNRTLAAGKTANLKLITMEKEFVPYELAVKLKQLGFDEPCLGRWLVITEWEKPTGEVRLQIGSKVENYSKNQCAAPLYQQAFRWFREKYGLHRHICYFEDTYFWHGDLYRLKDSGLMNCPMELTGYKTYEEAELACLSKLIEIMSNRLN